jgi:hypothetical protein
MGQLRDTLPERYCLIATLLVIIALVAGPAVAVPSATGALPIQGSAPVGNTVIAPGINASQPQPTTTALAPVVEYNKGYPIPVPVLVLVGVILCGAGGVLARRRFIHP